MSAEAQAAASIEAEAGGGPGSSRRWGARLGLALALLVGAPTAGFVALTRTQAGQDVVLNLVLDQARKRLNADVAVGSIRSGGLITGATLTGVSIAEPGRTPSFEADSITARYSLLGLVRGDLAFSALEVWDPRVVVERLPSENETNWGRILPGREPASSRAGAGDLGEGVAVESEAGVSGAAVADSVDGPSGEGPAVAPGDGALPGATAANPASTPRIVIRNGAVIGGEVAVRLPASGPRGSGSRARYVDSPDGDGVLVEQKYDEIHALLPRVDVGGEGATAVVELNTLSLEGRVVDEPFSVEDFRGTVRLFADSLALEAERLWLPGTETYGTASVRWGGEALEVDAQVTALTVDSESVHWIEPRLPRLRGGLALDLRVRGPRTDLTLSDIDVRTGAGQLRGRLGLALGRGLPRFDGDLQAQTLSPAFVGAWLEGPLPWDGLLSGRLQLRGTVEEFEVAGRVAVTDTAGVRPPSELELDGTVYLGEAPGVSDLSVFASPFYYGLAGELDPRIRLRGPGFVRVEADGRIDTGIRFSTSLAHYPASLPPSAVTAQGTVSGRGDGMRLDVSSTLSPLSLTALGAYYPEIAFTGEASGRVDVRGPLSDLSIDTELETPAGPFAARARLDGRNPGRQYLLEGDVEDFLVSRIMPSLPEPTSVTGSAFVDGRGLARDSIRASVRAEVVRATVGTVQVDSARTQFGFEAGVVSVDTLRVHTSLGRLNATGTLGLAEGLPPGEIRVSLVSESIAGIRPFFMGDSIIAADTLSPLEEEFLRFQGVDTDTLPLSRDVALDGRLVADATLRGSVDDFTAEGTGRVERVRYGPNALAAADVTYRLEALPGLDGTMRTTVDADSFEVLGRRFTGGALDLERTGPRGRFTATLDRTDEESYQTRATFELDSIGGVVNIDDLTARFEDARWNLGGPSSVSWDESQLSVRSFSLTRPGVDGMRIEADGVIPRGSGPADFDLTIRDLPLSRIVAVAQSSRELRGLVSLTLDVSGNARDPVMVGSLDARDVGYESLSFSSVTGELEYRGKTLSGELGAMQGGERVLRASGTVPADLGLREVERRFLDQPMDVRVAMESFPTAAVMGFLETFEQVEGTLDGEVAFAGTPGAPRPEGAITLSAGAADIPALGVRHQDVEATFELTPDATVNVTGSLRSGGQAEVTGSVVLRPLGDPSFDLTIQAQGFQAVNRRDISGVVSGELQLTQSYLRPAVEGQLNVEQGTLSLDEFARYSTIVDLSDTTFFAAVDTSLVAVRPVIASSQNPFLQSLRADVDMRILRDTWLRSRQIDIEIGGELQILYDRSTRDFVALGTLEAVRGSYRRFGRRFEVQEGTLEFLGIPGVNPNLDIEAVARLRTGDEPLNIIANVEGTLVNPVVSLSSDAARSIEEPELISYLVWGRPSALLGASESSILQGATEAGFTLGLGTLANELGSAVAQEIGFVDYFAITQSQAAQQLGPDVTLRNTLASTQIEVGRYFWDDVFLAFVLSPVGGASGQTRLPGARLEWQFTDQWALEGFIEDRLLRQGVLVSQESGLSLAHSLGLFVYREWGH